MAARSSGCAAGFSRASRGSSLGYSQTDTWLARSRARRAACTALSALLLVSAGALVALAARRRARARHRGGRAGAAVGRRRAAAACRVDARERSPPYGVAIVQGAISAGPEVARGEPRRHARALSRAHRAGVSARRSSCGPNRAAPDLANNLAPYLRELYAEAHARARHVVAAAWCARRTTGSDYYNSVLALGDDVGFYDKRHLVPFAEFFPVPDFVRSWLRLMSLPYSDFTRGAADAAAAARGGARSSRRRSATRTPTAARSSPRSREADALVNVTNDAWFGRSTARYQHFQIARMRAHRGAALHDPRRERRHLGGHRAARRGGGAAPEPFKPAVLRGAVRGTPVRRPI